MVVGNTETGDVELDLCHRIVALRPKDFAIAGTRRNLWPSWELPPDGLIPAGSTFVELTTIRHDVHSDGNGRFLDFQILERFASGPSPKERQAARARFFALYDALHMSEGWTGEASGGIYTDIRAIDGPRHLPDSHYVLNVTAWRPG